MVITSRSNPKLAYVRHLGRRAFRRHERRVLLEGIRLVEAALDAGARPGFALVSEALDQTERGRDLRRRLAELDVAVIEVLPALFGEVTATQHPQGILAVLPTPELPLPPEPDLVLVLDGLRDPGNLGTALRAAQAAGAGAVLLGPGTVDPTNPKVLRAAMGAHFRLPVVAAGWAELAAILRGLAIWLAEPGGELSYTAVDWRGPAAIVVSGEAHGASEAVRALPHRTVRIPMSGQADSLNAAVAAAVLLFEVVRQREGGAH